MVLLSRFIVSMAIIFVSSDSTDSSTKIGGCSAADILMVQNIVNEFIDIIDISLNQGTLTQELLDFFEENVAESFRQTIVNEDVGEQITVVEPRDVYLFGDPNDPLSIGLLFYSFLGNINTHYTTPYTKCTKDDSGEETATHTVRAVEHYVGGQVQPSGESINMEILFRIVYTLKKPEGYTSWTIAVEDVSLKTFNVFVNPPPKYKYMRGKIQLENDNMNVNDNNDNDTQVIILYVVVGILIVIILGFVIWFVLNKKRVKEIQKELQLIPTEKQYGSYQQ